MIFKSRYYHAILKSLQLSALVLSLSACGGSGGSSSNSRESLNGAQSLRGELQQYRFEQPGLPARDYLVYRPQSGLSGGMLVYLHGCNQTAEEAAIGTRWNELAEETGWLIVYPDQKDPNESAVEDQASDHAADGNGARCWNWFRPEHQQRGSGEPATIAGITQFVAETEGVDPDHIIVMGLSAGGIMAGTMAASYPDLYAGVAIVAGCNYPACADATGELAFQAMGEQAQRMPVIVFHGTADNIQPYAHALPTAQQWLGTNDLIDDGIRNQSVPSQANSTETSGFENRDDNSISDIEALCVRGANNPCLAGALGFEDSYPTTIERYVDANNCPLLDFWTIHGLAHNYPNGNTEASFTDPTGPDISRATYNFFINQHRDGAIAQQQATCE